MVLCGGLNGTFSSLSSSSWLLYFSRHLKGHTLNYTDVCMTAALCCYVTVLNTCYDMDLRMVVM